MRLTFLGCRRALPAATFCLLYAFPLLFVGHGRGLASQLALVFGWSFAGWGIGLYWWAGVIYVRQVRWLLADPEGFAPGSR